MSWNLPRYRYAWLEQEKGKWYFLTDLFANPEDSTRSWPDSRTALEELGNEGWTVVSPYPASTWPASPDHSRGYGLMRISDATQPSSTARHTEPRIPSVN